MSAESIIFLVAGVVIAASVVVISWLPEDKQNEEGYED